MGRASTYDPELRQKALAIAEATTVREASEQTGIPEGTIKRWRFEIRTERGEPSRANRTPKNLKVLQERVHERAVEEASEFVADLLKGMAQDLYGLASKAIRKVDVAISDPDELPEGKQGETHDRDGAAWVRSLVGVMAQAIDKGQLLSGRPTARSEELRRREIDITQRIIADPEAVRLAEQLLVRAAGRDAGALRLDGERGPLGALPAPLAAEPEAR